MLNMAQCLLIGRTINQQREAIKMKISKFEYQGPDGDGDISFDMEATVENSTEHVIQLVKTNCFLLNEDGVCAGGSADDEVDVYIDPKESSSIDVQVGWRHSASSFGGKVDKIKGIIDAVCFRREFQKMGEIEVPKDHNSSACYDKHINIGGIVSVLGGVCKRAKPDDDGDVTVSLEVGVRNISDSFVERVSARMILIDQEDAQIEDTEDNGHLAPHTGRILSLSVYTKAGKLRNATVRLSLAVFHPVEYKSAEAVAVKS